MHTRRALFILWGLFWLLMAVVSYVAFRDIFLGITENSPREQVFARVATAAGS